MKRNILSRRVKVAILFSGLTISTAVPPARADFVHPGVLFDAADLERMKAKRDVEPWKTGYADFLSKPQTSLDYAMQGPFEVVGRDPSENLKEYESDILAVEYGPIQWTVTGNPAYAEKAVRILDAWSTTHKKWSGSTPRLAAGWNAMNLCVGAEILRYSYPKWTPQLSARVEKYLLNVMWPMLGGEGDTLPNLADANQGAMALRGAIAIAVFCNDQKRFEAAIDGFLNHPSAGLVHGTLPSGQFGDFGRDQVHGGGQLNDLIFTAETAWKQKVDLYGALDNRLLTCMEYYAKYNLGEFVPFVPFGPAYGLYLTPSWDATKRGTIPDPGRKTGYKWVSSMGLTLDVYEGQKGLVAPYTTRYFSDLAPNLDTFLFKKDPGAPPATMASPPQPQPPLATPVPITSGLSSSDIGTTGVAGSSRFANATWKVKGSGSAIGKGADSFHFASRTLTGNGTIVARIASMENTDPNAKAGLMMRETLDANSPFVLASMRPDGAGDEFIVRTEKGGEAKRLQNHPGAATLPVWVKIERRGDLFIGYDSLDGVTWTVLRFKTIPMAKTIHAGLAVSAHNETALNTATFDHVAVGVG